MDFSEVLHTRRSIPSFDPNVVIGREELLSLLDLGNLAPSSMCMQPWEYVICDSAESKATLRAVSFDQKKITEASAVIILLGNTQAHIEHADATVDGYIAEGYFGEERREKWIASAAGGWPTEQKQRDEAFRGPSLWAMNFMLCAMNAGWDTAPMGGFDADGIRASFNIPAQYIPMLLICIGKRDPERTILPRVPRIPASKLAHFNTF